MDFPTDILASLGAMPLDRLLTLIALGGIGLAAFALHVVLTVVKRMYPK